MSMITRDISKGQLIPLVFGQDAVAASQTDVQLPTAAGEGSQAVDGYAMPFDYQVVAVSASLSAAATAGTLSIGATINGTEAADSTFVVTTATNAYQRVLRGKARGAAGSRLGAEITTNSGWDGTTSDLVVTVWVIASLDGI